MLAADKPRRGRPKGSKTKPPPTTASTPTPSDPSSSRGTPRLDLQAIISAAMEGSATPRPPSRDKSRCVYRFALGSAGIAISEGFITHHPKLPEPVHRLLQPIACIPSSMKEKFPAQCSKVSEEYFYIDKPSYLEDAQVAAIDYLFLKRSVEMYEQSTAGTTEASWALCTKDKVFMPLFDPTGKMKKVEDTVLSYPTSLGEVSRELTSPKPDILFGSSFNRSNLVSEFYEDSEISAFSLDHRRLRQMMTFTELLEAGCGATGEIFCFPTFVVERKSDCEPLYHAENQLLGALRCMFEAQKIAKSRVNNELPILPLGITNVGNWISFWACWPNNSREGIVMSAAHVADFHLFKVESAIEFVSLTVQVVQWIYEYQEKLFNGIMKDKASPTTVFTVGTKRDHGSDDEDQEEIRSKRQNTKQTGVQTATEPAAAAHMDPPPPEQPEKGAKESSVVDSAEPGQCTLNLDLESEDPPDPRERDQKVSAYLQNQESPSLSYGEAFEVETTGVGVAEFYHRLMAIESPPEMHVW